MKKTDDEIAAVAEQANSLFAELTQIVAAMNEILGVSGRRANDDQ